MIVILFMAPDSGHSCNHPSHSMPAVLPAVVTQAAGPVSSLMDLFGFGMKLGTDGLSINLGNSAKNINQPEVSAKVNQHHHNPYPFYQFNTPRDLQPPMSIHFPAASLPPLPFMASSNSESSSGETSPNVPTIHWINNRPYMLMPIPLEQLTPPPLVTSTPAPSLFNMPLPFLMSGGKAAPISEETDENSSLESELNTALDQLYYDSTATPNDEPLTDMTTRRPCGSG